MRVELMEAQRRERAELLEALGDGVLLRLDERTAGGVGARGRLGHGAVGVDDVGDDAARPAQPAPRPTVARGDGAERLGLVLDCGRGVDGDAGGEDRREGGADPLRGPDLSWGSTGHGRPRCSARAAAQAPECTRPIGNAGSGLAHPGGTCDASPRCVEGESALVRAGILR
jgi:hypothetical protein